MRSHMLKLASGKMEHNLPLAKIPEDKLDIVVTKPGNYQGAFVVESENGNPLKGLVFCHHPRMHCFVSAVNGVREQIRFEFDASNMEEGEVENGSFLLILNGTEQSVDFTVSRLHRPKETSAGMIHNMSEFLRLSQYSFAEAYEIFRSPGFAEWILCDNEKDRLYYEALTANGMSYAALEQFLLASRQKEPVKIRLESKPYSRMGMNESTREEIILIQDKWGYAKIEISCKGRFLKTDRAGFTTLDFIGSCYVLPYYIQADELHAGWNYGEITLTMRDEIIHFPVSVHKEASVSENRSDLLFKRTLCRLVECYLSYRLKQTDFNAFLKEADKLLLEIKGSSVEKEEAVFRLLHVHRLILGGSKEEALQQLEQYYNMGFSPDVQLEAYASYLSMLLKRDESFLALEKEKVAVCAEKMPESNLIAWIGLFLNEEYEKDKRLKLAAIKEQGNGRTASALLYMEALYLYETQPYLLDTLGTFEIRLIKWEPRHHLLSKELAEQFVQLCTSYQGESRIVIPVLLGLSDLLGTDKLCSVVCMHLVRSGQYRPEYFAWIEQAVKQDLSMTKLYESYMMLRPADLKEPLPKAVKMYFYYDCSLDEDHTAALYAAVIRDKEEDHESYDLYIRRIDEFALSMLQKQRINDDYLLIYTECIRRGMLEEKAAAGLSALLFYHKLDLPKAHPYKKIIVRAQRLGAETVCPVVHERAYVPIYPGECVMVGEDSYGRRIALPKDFQIEKLLLFYKYKEQIDEVLPNDVNQLLRYFDRQPNCVVYDEKDMIRLDALLNQPGLSADYKEQLYRERFSYEMHRAKSQQKKQYLSSLNQNLLQKEERICAIVEMIGMGMYRTAYEWMVEDELYHIPPQSLADLCAGLIEEGMPEDELFLDLCVIVWEAGCLNEKVADYLLSYFHGSSKQMEQLWKDTNVYPSLDRHMFEEVLIAQSLFTREYLSDMEEIYADYCKGGAADLVKQAYLSAKSYGYFVLRQMQKPQFLDDLYGEYERGSYLNEGCRLSLMKLLAEAKQRSQKQTECMRTLLEQCLEKKQYFDCYHQMDEETKAIYFLRDRRVIEYHILGDRPPYLHYRYEKEEEFQTVAMQQMFDTVYASVLPCRPGTAIEYYITEYDKPKQPEDSLSEMSDMMEESGRKENILFNEQRFYSRLDYLEAMEKDAAREDMEAMSKHMADYLRMEERAKRLFGIL